MLLAAGSRLRGSSSASRGALENVLRECPGLPDAAGCRGHFPNLCARLIFSPGHLRLSRILPAYFHPRTHVMEGDRTRARTYAILALVYTESRKWGRQAEGMAWQLTLLLF